MKILYEDNHLLVVDKPINMPVQADISKDNDLLSEVKQYLASKYNKSGNIYLGLVHRLDRPVGGICVLAKTSKAASRLSASLRNNKFQKGYEAVVIDNDLEKQGSFIDYLKKDRQKNIVYIDPNGKKAILEYQVFARKDNLALVKINLITGRSHQIRVQFASRNHPLYGDQKYNPNAIAGQQIALYASYLAFPHPTKNEIMTFESHNYNYPFSIWGEE